MPPQPVKSELRESLGDYWLKRVEQHTGDSYAGLGMSKFPEDLRVYEHLLWESAPTRRDRARRRRGGSALWFRDRLAAFSRYGAGPRPFVVSSTSTSRPPGAASRATIRTTPTASRSSRAT